MAFLHREGEVVWAVPPSVLSDADLDGLVDELNEHLALGKAYVLLFDLSRAAVPSPLQRTKLTRHIRDNDARIRRSVRGLGIVLGSTVARGMVTAVFWVSPPPVPYRTFSGRGAAAAWANAIWAGREAAV